MKNPLCFSCFSNSAKPNRLIFDEKFPEGQKSTPAEAPASKEQIQESHTLSCERVLVLESFRRRAFDSTTNFDGDDSTKAEIAQNEVFQYLCEKLNGFFKTQTSPEWPVNRQTEWMNVVTNLVIVSWRGLKSLNSKEDVDALIPSFIIEGHDEGRKYGWYPGIGSFPAWFSKKYPVEYYKIFGKKAGDDQLPTK